MKYIFFFLFISLLGSPVSVQAEGSIAEWLSKLDHSLAQRDQYEKQRVGRIDKIKKELESIEKLPNKKSDNRYYLLAV